MTVTEDEILELIETKTAERRTLFGQPEAAAKVDADLAKLYDELRAVRVGVSQSGRTAIVKRARIERELEKLML